MNQSAQGQQQSKQFGAVRPNIEADTMGVPMRLGTHAVGGNCPGDPPLPLASNSIITVFCKSLEELLTSLQQENSCLITITDNLGLPTIPRQGAVPPEAPADTLGKLSHAHGLLCSCHQLTEEIGYQRKVLEQL